MRHVVGALTIAALAACGREGAVRSETGLLRIALSHPADGAAAVVATGLAGAELDALRDAGWSVEAWQRLLSVTVAGAESVVVAGRYVANDTAIVFRPLFPLDPGRDYVARLDPARLPTPRADSIVIVRLGLPARAATPPTTVVGLLPSGDTLPENQLRLYIRFSAPMSNQGGVPYVRLLDDRGVEVRDAFLPLDADFWNRDHTRYTLFLDPGRVKQGILPNEQMGRALRAGRSYTLEIAPAWPDGEGRPLAAPYRRTFVAGPADEARITLASWHVSAPAAGAREPLIVTFPEPLDHALLERALGVETSSGRAVAGDIAITDHERRWAFVPREAWRAGAYQVLVLGFVEDRAGNRIGRAFEVDMFETADQGAVPERYTIPFTIR